VNNKINLLVNDEKEIKTIDLRIKRNTYFNQENDITIIELNKSDNIKCFLELDDNLFRHNNQILYENKSLYVLQYPQGRKAAVSYGLLTSLNKSEIKHTCSTEYGSSGSPILNLESNKVIGIHIGGSMNFEFNKGTYLKYILIDFIQKNTNKIKENQYSVINNISNNNADIQNNFENYNNMTFNNFNIGENNYLNQLNINNLVLNPNTTVDEMLTVYLKKIKKPELIGQKANPRFLYNAMTLYFGDKTPILNIFKSVYLNQKIIVEWPDILIGGP